MAFRVEAESFSVDASFKIKSLGTASGDKVLQAKGSGEQRASYVFDQPTGTYDLTFGYFDENDGISNSAVLVNGIEIDSWLWDQDLGSTLANSMTATTRTITGVQIDQGGVIEVIGMKNGGEPLRFDFIDFAEVPGIPPASLRIEAEDFTRDTGFKVKSLGVASDDKVLQAKGDGEQRASYVFEGQDGTYDLNVGYFDENDGTSNVAILVNGVEIDSWLWDQDFGSALANSMTATSRLIQGVRIDQGDVIEIVGMKDGGEPLRLDFLHFDPSDGGVQPTPDLWYEDDGEVIIALNDGTGAFTERGTGIAVGDADILSGDFNSDGNIDFLRVISSGESAPSTGPDDFEFDISTTVFENDGSGNFTPGQTSTFSVYHPSGDNFEFVFKAHDAKDVDGDGDVDFLATESAGSSSFLLQNDGTGNFSLLERSFATLGRSNDALLADFDGNEALDAVIFTDSLANEVGVYINDGSGLLEFSDSTSPSPESFGDGQVLDLDGDDDQDVVFVASGESRGIYAFLNDGTGMREEGLSPRFTSGEDGFIGSMEAGNFDDDPGIEVISAGAEDDDGVDPGLRVFDVVETADGTEFVLKSFDPSISGNVVANADFDLDGDLDLLIVPRTGPFEMTLLLNDGDANFTSAGVVLPEFVTSEFSFAPRVQVAHFDDNLLLS